MTAKGMLQDFQKQCLMPCRDRTRDNQAIIDERKIFRASLHIRRAKIFRQIKQDGAESNWTFWLCAYKKATKNQDQSTDLTLVFCYGRTQRSQIVTAMKQPHFVKYDGKDSVEISCDEFLEVPLKQKCVCLLIFVAKSDKMIGKDIFYRMKFYREIMCLIDS